MVAFMCGRGELVCVTAREIERDALALSAIDSLEIERVCVCVTNTHCRRIWCEVKARREERGRDAPT